MYTCLLIIMMTHVIFCLYKIYWEVLFFTKTHFMTLMIPIDQSYKRTGKMKKPFFFHQKKPVALRWIQPKNSAGEELIFHVYQIHMSNLSNFIFVLYSNMVWLESMQQLLFNMSRLLYEIYITCQNCSSARGTPDSWCICLSKANAVQTKIVNGTWLLSWMTIAWQIPIAKVVCQYENDVGSGTGGDACYSRQQDDVSQKIYEIHDRLM